MSVLTLSQATTYAQQAGFSGSSLATILAISRAESGLNTNAVNPNDPYGGSYGIVQINGAHFQSGATTKTCALDPACAYKFAYSLSNRGADFTPWGSYTNGSYRQYLGQIVGGSASASQPQQQQPQSSSSPGFITGITEHVFVFLIAVTLVIVGFILIARKPIEGAVERGAFL